LLEDNINNISFREDLELGCLDGLEIDLVTVISNENNDFEQQIMKPLQHMLIRCTVYTLHNYV